MLPQAESTIIITLAVLIVLNSALIVWLIRLSHHYNALTSGIDKKTLMSVLEGIQKTLSLHERELSSQKKVMSALGQDSKIHLQRLSLKRFNPFSDTGGDQSFMLALLDGNKDGVVITSLHSREHTRFYIKEVKGGKGEGHSLSVEEQKLI